VRNSAPLEGFQQADGFGFGHRAIGVQPPGRSDLGGAGQGHAEQLGLGPGQSRVSGDGVGHCLHREASDPIHSFPNGRLVAQIGFENQPECPLVTAIGAVHEIEVSRQHVVDPAPVVLGLGQCGPHSFDQLLRMRVQQRQVQVELAGKVLIQHRLGHPGANGDVIHRRRVIAVGDEDVLRRSEQLLTPSRPGQPRTASRIKRFVGHRCQSGDGHRATAHATGQYPIEPDVEQLIVGAGSLDGVSDPLALAQLADPVRYRLSAPDPHRPPYASQTVTVDGTRLNVRSIPPTNESPAEPALYIHGLGGASTNFTDLAALLTPWFDGQAIDLPGFGHSGPPATGSYSIASHARLVSRFIEESGRGPVHLIGNSMGGAIAIVVAAERADLVRTLTLISPAVPDIRPKAGGDLLIPLLLLPGVGTRALSRLDRTTSEARARALIKLCFAHPERVPPNRLAEAIEEIEVRRATPWAHDALLASLRGLVKTYLARGARSPWRLMARITAPTLVIWGELDRLVDVSRAPRTARTIPDATLLVLPDVGHTAQLEDPLITARAILGLQERAYNRSDMLNVGVWPGE